MRVVACVSQSWQEVASKASDHVVHSVVSVKVTSDISAQCNASNAMGTEVKVFSIRASESLRHRGSRFIQSTAQLPLALDGVHFSAMMIKRNHSQSV